MAGVRNAASGALPEELVDAAADQRPVSLHWSVPSVGPLLGLPVVFLVVLAYTTSWGLWLVSVALIFALIVGIRRIDVDATTLTVVPILPLLPRQQLPFAVIGPFSRKDPLRAGRAGLQAQLSDGQRFRAANIWPSRKLSLVAVYGPSTLSKALTGDQLIAFLETYRTAAR